jgi:hypothetical protein
MPSSQSVFWIGASQNELAEARDLLQRNATPGVIDELGYLQIANTIAERLYPAVNTIMTHGRYLVFVPAILRYIESLSRKRRRTASAHSRALQAELCDVLKKNHDDSFTGIIGKEKGKDVVRPPSNIYWSALYQLGIAKRAMSEAAYLSQLDPESAADDAVKDDDGVLHASDAEPFWDPRFKAPGIVTPEGQIASRLTFEFTSAEAAQLSHRYRDIRFNGEPSLIGHMLDLCEQGQPARIERWNYTWDVPHQPVALRTISDHAKCLSLLARGTTLQYHALLFIKRRQADKGTREAFEAWWPVAVQHLPDWDVAELLKQPFLMASVRSHDLAFLTGWRDIVCNANSATQAYSSEKARKLICEREARIRLAKARLRSAYHLKTWEAPKRYFDGDLFTLTYRHPTARVITRELVAGMIGGET